MHLWSISRLVNQHTTELVTLGLPWRYCIHQRYCQYQTVPCIYIAGDMSGVAYHSCLSSKFALKKSFQRIHLIPNVLGTVCPVASSDTHYPGQLLPLQQHVLQIGSNMFYRLGALQHGCC